MVEIFLSFLFLFFYYYSFWRGGEGEEHDRTNFESGTKAFGTEYEILLSDFIIFTVARLLHGPGGFHPPFPTETRFPDLVEWVWSQDGARTMKSIEKI